MLSWCCPLTITKSERYLQLVTFDDQDWSIVACFHYTGSIAASLIAKVPKKAIRTHQKSILVAWKKCWQMVAHTWQVGNAVCPRWISKFCQLTRTTLLPTSTWGLQGLNFCSELSHIFWEHYPHVVPLVNVKQNHEHIQTTHISIHFLSIRLPSESSLPSFSPSLWQIRWAAARSSRTDASVIFDMSGSDWASRWESRNAAPRFFRIVSTC